MRTTGAVKGLAVWLSLVVAAGAEQPYLERAHWPAPVRSYLPSKIPGAVLHNSSRLHRLIRAGRLYLTVQDALALAIENNLDLEVDRYGTLIARSTLERARAGGPVRGVPSASAQVASVNSGVGVNGSLFSAGLLNNNFGSNGGNGGAASIQQVGAITPNLDPTLQNTTTFAHLSEPQANTSISGTNSLVQSIHTYATVLQLGLVSGGLFQYRDYDQYLKENSPYDYLDPVVGPHMDLYLRHNLLQGFGTKLNDRFIRVAKINVNASRETFRSQLLDLTVGVLNLYWDMVSANDELRVRQSALDNAQKFYEDTRKEISAGALPRVELPRAAAEAASRRHDLAVSQLDAAERATLMKLQISRTPDPELDAAEIVTLDHVTVPDNEELPPLRQLVASAMAKRPDVAATKYRLETAQMQLIGTENPLLPTLQVFAQTYDRGLAGSPQIVQGVGPTQYFAGGYGAALKQIFHRNFPNNQGGASFSIPLNNRQAQGDYGIDQLQFRQSEVSAKKETNQIVVDISNQISALRQSRARYLAAQQTRALQEELLAAERKKFAYGISTFNDVILDQRALVTAQISELTAMANYAHARVALDQVLGETLEKNHISVDEALSGEVH
jgi:outer membrane protein TolC